MGYEMAPISGDKKINDDVYSHLGFSPEPTTNTYTNSVWNEDQRAKHIPPTNIWGQANAGNW